MELVGDGIVIGYGGTCSSVVVVAVDAVMVVDLSKTIPVPFPHGSNMLTPAVNQARERVFS